MGILFVPMLCVGLIMLTKNPELLRKRLNAKETEKEQKTIVAFSGVFFVAMFVVAGLNFFYCFTPTTWAQQQVSVATLMGLRISEAL